MIIYICDLVIWIQHLEDIWIYIYTYNSELVIKIQLPEEMFQFHRFGDSFQLREPASTWILYAPGWVQAVQWYVPMASLGSLLYQLDTSWGPSMSHPFDLVWPHAGNWLFFWSTTQLNTFDMFHMWSFMFDRHLDHCGERCLRTNPFPLL